jgi:uncharacterized protein
MKYLVVLLVVFVGVWVWRSNRIAISKESKENQENFEREAERQQAKKTMVACAHCGVHLPQIEALAAPSADLRSQLWFCSTEHRQFGQNKAKQS